MDLQTTSYITNFISNIDTKQNRDINYKAGVQIISPIVMHEQFLWNYNNNMIVIKFILLCAFPFLSPNDYSLYVVYNITTIKPIYGFFIRT